MIQGKGRGYWCWGSWTQLICNSDIYLSTDKDMAGQSACVGVGCNIEVVPWNIQTPVKCLQEVPLWCQEATHTGPYQGSQTSFWPNALACSGLQGLLKVADWKLTETLEPEAKWVIMEYHHLDLEEDNHSARIRLGEDKCQVYLLQQHLRLLWDAKATFTAGGEAATLVVADSYCGRASYSEPGIS